MNTIKFLEEVDKLKKVKRTGWVERGVKLPESSADHSFMVAFQCLVLGSDRKDLNMNNVLKMALIHDIVESQTGDIISKDNWKGGGTHTGKEKYDIERTSLEKLLKNIYPKLEKELINAWLEFEEGRTRDAIFVRSVDKFEMIFQAMQYHKDKNFKKDLTCFWNENGVASVKDPQIKKILLKKIKELD